MPPSEKKSAIKPVAPDDLWTILLKEKEKEKENSKDAEAETGSLATSGSNLFESSYTSEKVVVLLGEFNSGKSTIINCMTKSKKKLKSTISLDYDFVHAKKSNILYNLWEIGGEFLDSNLLEVPVTLTTAESSSLFIVLDMSKPSSLIPRLKHYFKLIKKSVKDSLEKKLNEKNKRAYDRLKDNVFLRYHKHRDFNENGTILRPFNIPITIIATKTDQLSHHLAADNILVLQALRFISHYYGASLVTGNHNESKEVFNRVLQGATSDQIYKELESSRRTAKEKKLLSAYLAGHDSFQDIFEDNLKDPQGRLARDEHEFKDKFLNRDKTKISTKFMEMIQEVLEKVFGPCTEKFEFSEAELDEDKDNHRDFREDEAFSEPVIDEMIAIKKAALEKSIIENDRHNELLLKQKL